MRRSVFATLILLVALAARIGASLSMVAAPDAFAAVDCHPRVVALSPAAGPSQPSDDKGAPAHRHADCAFCQSGFSDAPTLAVPPPPQLLRAEWRVALPESEAPALRRAFNRSAPARAPPSLA
jgi:hypothetical protein